MLPRSSSGALAVARAIDRAGALGARRQVAEVRFEVTGVARHAAARLDDDGHTATWRA